MNFISKYTGLDSTKSVYVMIGFLAAALLPFFILNYFNQPIPEDIYYTEETRRFGFVTAFRILYKYWGGRYFCYIFLCVNPLLFKSIVGYKLVTFFCMILFLYVLYLFVSEVTKNFLSLIQKIVLSLIIFFLYLYSMASVAEGFYWFASVAAYHFAIILIMAFAVFYLRALSEESKRMRIINITVACLLMAAIPGSSEFGAALIAFIMPLLILQSIVQKRKIDWLLLLLTVIMCVGLFFLFKAKGNYNRAVPYEGKHNIIFSVYNSFLYIARNMIQWIFNSTLLPFTLLLLPLFIKSSKYERLYPRIYQINPFISLGVWLLAMLLCVFVILWSMGALPYERISNFIYFVFLIGWFWNFAILVFYFSKKYNLSSASIPKIFYPVACIYIVLFLFIPKNNVKDAFSDLFTGTAQKYEAELAQRFDYLNNSSCDSCGIDPIKSDPQSLHFFDINYDPKVVSNQGYSRYFDKKYIYLKKEE